MKIAEMVSKIRFSVMAALVAAMSFGGVASAAPIIDNNAGTWTDTYNDNLGVRLVQQTVVDSASGIARLVSGQTQGTFTTVRIKPPSFDKWGTLKLDGTWSSPSDVRVTVVSTSRYNATVLGPVDYNGEISLANIDPVRNPELAVIVQLKEGAVSPVVSTLSVSWNPVSVLLLDKTAPESVLAGQRITYRIRYSVNYVEAQNLVVWDKLPRRSDNTMTYPAYYGQKDDVSFVEASEGGAYTAVPITVNGVAVPAGSVYWDLGTKPEGATETLWFTVRTQNGTLNKSKALNSATASARNARTVKSATVNTLINSSPSPSIVKRAGEGIYSLVSGNYTFVDMLNRFTIEAKNNYISEGRETMYGVVVYDDLSNLIDKIDPNLGGADIPVVGITPAGGYYTPSYTPPAGGTPFPAVVWTNRPALGPGESFYGSFAVRLLDSPPLPEVGSYTNTVWLDSNYTAPISSSLKVSWPADETPFGAFAKGDNLDSFFGISATEDDRALFVKPGGSFPYGLSVNNIGMVALNDIVLLDMVPTNTTFKSAWFTDPWLKTNAVIFYSTTDTGNMDQPPAYGVTNAPADIDIDGGDFWSSTPPENPADVKWVAYYIPAVNSFYSEPGAAGWVDGAPRTVVGFFDVAVSPTMLEPHPCVDKLLVNRGIYNVFGYTPMAGGKVAVNVRSTNDESTRVAVDKPILSIAAPGRVSPSVIENPGQLAYTVSVQNRGTATAEDVLLEISWPYVNVNGVKQYISFDSVSPATIKEFDPEHGRLVLEMGNVAPGASATATLKATAGGGLVFGEQLTFSSTATASGRCIPDPASDNASAIARFAPSLKVYKDDVLDLIPSGGFLDYTLALYNTGDAPSRGTFVVDRIPDEMVLVNATGPNGERVWFSATDNLPPAFLSATQPVNAATIASSFSLGTKVGDTWTSPFGDQTRWVAWEMDQNIGGQMIYPVGGTSVVGMRLKNDADGPGPGTEGSEEGVQIFNTTGVFSTELLQAIGNEVVTTIKIAPGILVDKTGPSIVSKGDVFSWSIAYYNNSGIDDDVVYIEDTLPAGVEFISASHAWNQVAAANGAPADNSGLAVPTSVSANADGTTKLLFDIAGDNGYRGAGADLRTQEGGTLTVTVRAKADLPTNSDLLNFVKGTAIANEETSVSSDEHLVLVRNAELRVRKLATPAYPVAGDTVTYNLIIANSGQMSARDVVITDTLPAGVTYLENSTTMLTSKYTIGQPAVSGRTISWSVAASNALTKTGLPAGELPALSGDVVIQYKGVVAADVPPGTELPNTVTVSTVTPEDGSEPNEDDASVNTPHPDPVVVKNGPSIVQSGDRFDWTITYYNATRQAGHNVYIVDSLPDADGDGFVDVTFVEQKAEGPGAVTAYYHSGSSGAAPAFDPLAPLSGGWTNAPVVPVQHIAWLVGTLPGSAGPYDITVTVDVLPPTGGVESLPAGTALPNVVEIFTTDPDQDPDNNTDEHTVRTPANDVALTKTGSTEGAIPGLTPGDAISYEIVVENTGTEIAYGLEVNDIVPEGLDLQPESGQAVLALFDASGEASLPVDAMGGEITTEVPLTRTLTTNGVAWFFGSTDESSPMYYRNIGILPGQRQILTLEGNIALDVVSGTRIINVATVTIRNKDDSDPPEEFLGNNTDSTDTVVYRPDMTVRKSVVDVTTGDEDWTENGRLLKYTIEYNNFGEAKADNVVISEIVPAGTTLVSVNNPANTTVTYYPTAGAGARGFEVNLGTVDANPNKVYMAYWGAKNAVEIENGSGGLPAGSLTRDSFGVDIAALGDVDGDGVSDILVGASSNTDGGLSAGAGWVLLMNTDGTVKSAVELANGKNGVAAGTFGNADRVGWRVGALGDVDGNGIPDAILYQEYDDTTSSDRGGAFVVLLNGDGTAKSVVEMQNGKNGVPEGTFLGRARNGYSFTTGTDMDGDGVPDVFMGRYVGAGDAYAGYTLLLLNPDGTAKRVVSYVSGKNGVPAGSFTQTGLSGSLAIVGDVDGNGVPDILAGCYPAANFAGGGWIVLMNPDLTVKSAVRLTNGYNGVPAGTYLPWDQVGNQVHSIGDFDKDGVPDALFAAPGLDYATGVNSSSGGAILMLLNADGTAKSLLKLQNGSQGIPENTFQAGEQVGVIGTIGDVDGDGVTDIMLGGWVYTIWPAQPT